MRNEMKSAVAFSEGGIKKLLATIILLYLPLAYFWPEIFLKSKIFLVISLLAALVFFIELKLKEKIVLLAVSGTLGLLLFRILPAPFEWLLNLNLSLPLVIGLGALAIFLIILIEIKLLLFIYEKIFT